MGAAMVTRLGDRLALTVAGALLAGAVLAGLMAGCGASTGGGVSTGHGAPAAVDWSQVQAYTLAGQPTTLDARVTPLLVVSPRDPNAVKEIRTVTAYAAGGTRPLVIAGTYFAGSTLAADRQAMTALVHKAGVSNPTVLLVGSPRMYVRSAPAFVAWAKGRVAVTEGLPSKAQVQAAVQVPPPTKPKTQIPFLPPPGKAASVKGGK